MGKSKYSSFNLDFIGDSMVSAVSMHYKRLSELFDEKEIERVLDESFKYATQEISAEMLGFVLPSGSHYLSGATADSFAQGEIEYDKSHDMYRFRLGFDTKKGGWPALILEYGDSGSPMRMPNTAYYFIYKAQKKHDALHSMSWELNRLTENYIAELKGLPLMDANGDRMK